MSTTFESLEPADTLPMEPGDLTWLKVRQADEMYTSSGVPSPVSGDAITLGKAEWAR